MIYRDQLEAVRKLIERPEAWCQGSWGRTSDGVDVSSKDEHAVQWCLSGALSKCGIPYESNGEERNLALFGDTETRVLGFNDSRTHAEVLALLDSAIQRAPVREVSP